MLSAFNVQAPLLSVLRESLTIRSPIDSIASFCISFLERVLEQGGLRSDLDAGFSMHLLKRSSIIASSIYF